MTSKSIIIAHGLNIAGWVSVVFTLLAFKILGKPAFFGACLTIPLFALSIKCYNMAAQKRKPMN